MRTVFTSLLLLLSIHFTFGQTGSIEGLINDAATRLPVTGASVNLPGNKGDNTDLFGRFRIVAVNPGQYEMVVSHVGYKTEIIPVEVKSGLLSNIAVNIHKKELDLAEVRIDSRKNTALNTIGSVDIMLRPVNTSQDVLRIVPGLFIAQHAGGGKAEQIFLRGFDIDHGTDIAITVDGMPVNMVSHAHGQGYADLHFLIPEAVEKVNFDKGPYFAGKGNLATAAYVDFQTKDFLDKQLVRLEGGDFKTFRAVALVKLFEKQTATKRQQLYIGSEYSATDGYFESPQDFHRLNLMAKYSLWVGNQSQLSVTGSFFDSKWYASGQVPDRAIRSGMISRFGAIDDNEGGNTGRANFTIKYSNQLKNNWKASNQLYYSKYDFNLFSNFTFFLEDPVNGDMINQHESRNIFGYLGSATKTWLAGKRKATTEFGAGLRYDQVNDLRLSHAIKRVITSDIQSGQVRENNIYAYVNQDIELSDKINMNAGLRYDHFTFRYRDQLAGANSFDRQSRGTISPKLNFTYTINPGVRLFLNNGIGFHSNDTRVILENSADDILPKVIGTDFGVILKPVSGLVVKAAVWHLYSEQEFVYVGDAGIVEAGGKTRRWGADLSARYQFTPWLFGDVDLNLCRARGIGEPENEDYIPLAPSFTSIGGLTARNKKGFSGSLRYRYLGDRPANEIKSVIAQGYFILDALAAYQWKKWEIRISAENLLDATWKEAQFDTESRLPGETDPVSEIHFTPGIPRFLKAGISFSF